MTLDHEQRAHLAALRRQIKILEGPETKAKADLRRKNRQARAKAIGKPAQGQRQPRVEDPAYLAALRLRACCVGPIMGDPCQGRTDPAHIRYSRSAVGRINPGKARKPDDFWCLPVCRKHHDAQHAYGNESRWWSVEVGVDPDDLARAIYADFQAGGDGSAVMARFTPSETI